MIVDVLNNIVTVLLILYFVVLHVMLLLNTRDSRTKQMFVLGMLWVVSITAYHILEWSKMIGYDLLNSTFISAFVEWPRFQLIIVFLLDLFYMGYLIYSRNLMREKTDKYEQINIPQMIFVIIVVGCVLVIINMAVLANIYEYIHCDLEITLVELIKWFNYQIEYLKCTKI